MQQDHDYIYILIYTYGYSFFSRAPSRWNFLVVKKYKIKITFTAYKKIRSILQDAKSNIYLEHQEVYEIPCQDQTDILQNNSRVNVKNKTRHNTIRKEDWTSSLVQDVGVTTHTINSNSTHMKHRKRKILREAIEIEKRTNNLSTWDYTQHLPTKGKLVPNKTKNRIFRSGVATLVESLTCQHVQNQTSGTDEPV